MTFQKFKFNSDFNGGRHYTATTNIHGDTTLNKKTNKNKIIKRHLFSL